MNSNKQKQTTKPHTHTKKSQKIKPKENYPKIKKITSFNLNNACSYSLVICR